MLLGEEEKPLAEQAGNDDEIFVRIKGHARLDAGLVFGIVAAEGGRIDDDVVASGVESAMRSCRLAGAPRSVAPDCRTKIAQFEYFVFARHFVPCQSFSAASRRAGLRQMHSMPPSTTKVAPVT